MGNLQIAWKRTNQERRRRVEALQRIKNGSARMFENLPKKLREDAEIASAAIQKYPWRNWEIVPCRLKTNKEFVLSAVQVRGYFLRNVSEELRCDRDIVLVAVRQDGFLLEYASEELRGDREIVLGAVAQRGWALRFASEELRNDRELVLTAVRQNGRALEFASEELRANPGVVLEAVHQDGLALRYATEEQHGNREIVMEAVQQNGGALQFSSEELCGDRDIVFTAVRHTGYALRYASKILRGDREIVLTAVQGSGDALFFVGEELRADREIILAALANRNRFFKVQRILRRVSNDLLNDPMVAGAIIRAGGNLPRGSEIMQRLDTLLLAVGALPKDFTQHIVDEKSVVEFSRGWEHSVWYKIWLVFQLEPSTHTDGIGRLFVELSGLPLELRQAKELRHCAPVIVSVQSSFPRRDWKDLDSYPTYEYDSD